MARVRAVVVGSLAALAATVLFLVGLFLFLERAERGQRVVLDYLLGRVEGAIDGTITVEGIRSGRLTRGATLYGVRVRGAEGRPFLEVDSAEARYSWRTFLSGDVVLSRLVVWGPRLTVSRYPGEEDFNADRIFRTDPEEPGSDEKSARRVVFHEVRLVDAFVEVLYPVDPEDPPPERMMTVTRPGAEGELQRHAFEAVQAWMPTVVVMSPEAEGPVVTLDSLSMTGRVYEDPFRLTQLEGQVTWADGTLVVFEAEGA